MVIHCEAVEQYFMGLSVLDLAIVRSKRVKVVFSPKTTGFQCSTVIS